MKKNRRFFKKNTVTNRLGNKRKRENISCPGSPLSCVGISSLKTFNPPKYPRNSEIQKSRLFGLMKMLISCMLSTSLVEKERMF